MGFYGNVSNITRSTFQFDRIYSNRKAMERALATGDDDVYIGRYVLIEYDQAIDFDVFTRIFAHEVEIGTEEDKQQQTWFYTEKYKAGISDKKLVSGIKGQYYYTATDNASASSSQLTNVVLYKCVKDKAYILGAPTNATEDDHIGFIAVADIKEEDSEAIHYTINYNIDTDPDNGYGNGRGYDGTVWMKTYVGDNIKYVMIAELNSVVPTFAVSVDAPSEVPNQPHFGKDSTNVYYDLHVQPSWGFRIKEAIDENGNRTPSDEKVYHNSSYYDINGTEQHAENIITEVSGDIYYNAKGFDVDYSNHETKLTDIIKLTKGQSGRAYNYHDPESNITTLQKADDIQELSIHLPAIGNAVAHLYDVLYGDGSDSEEGNKRNKNIDWYYHGYLNKGLRLSEFFNDEVDEETGQIKEGYRYYPDRMKTVAASINTLHDFIGMIIDENSYKSSKYKDDKEGRQQQFIDTSDENTIYYDSDTNKYYRKAISYDYIEQVNYDYPSATVNVNNYQPNLYFVEDGTGFKPDEGTEYREINYYTRRTRNDEYYDKVDLIDYNPGDFYSLVNGVFTKSTGNTFEKALNYYRLDKGNSIEFNGVYSAGNYYIHIDKKDAKDGVEKYQCYNDKNVNDKNFQTIYTGLNAIVDQDIRPVKFYQQGLWFQYVQNKDLKGYFVDKIFDPDKTYWLIDKVVITKIANINGDLVDIYEPASNAHAIPISPKEFKVFDISKKATWENCIFTMNGNDFIPTTAVETTIQADDPSITPDKETGQYPAGTAFTITYNDEDKTIYYKKFQPVVLYTPGNFYSEDKESKIKFSRDAENALSPGKNYYEFDPNNEKQVQPVHNNKDKYFYEPCPKGQVAPQIGYYFTKDDNGYHIMEQEKITGLTGPFYKLSNNDLYVMADTNHVYDKYTVWNSNASIVPCSITLNRRKEKYVFEELKEFGIQYNTLLGILLEARRVLATSLDTPEETRDTSTVQGCINKLNDIFAYFDNRYPGQFLITDAYDRIVNAPITTAQTDEITNFGGEVKTTSITTPIENRWIEVNINSDPVDPQIKYQHNFNPVNDTYTSSNKNKQLEANGDIKDTRGGGLNNSTDDKLLLYTPIVDGMGHVVGKNREVVTLPYGYKTFTTNGAVETEDDFYSTINIADNGANTTTITVSGINQSMADNTQDTIAIEPANKWIQTKITNDQIDIAHAIHAVDTTKKDDTNINDNGDTITLQDMVFDKAGHIIENRPHTYTLPYGFKKIEVINTASNAIAGNETKDLATTITTTVVANNSQDTFHIMTGNRWIRMSAKDGTDNQIVIQHETHNTSTTTASINLTSAEPQSFETKEYSFDDAGHLAGTLTTTISIPNNYGIFTDGKSETVASGSQDTITINGDAHILPTIGKDTLTISHQVAQTATQCSTASGLVVNFGDSFTIPNIYYDDNGHIERTDTFTITIPQIATPDNTATTATSADVIKTITIDATTGTISATRANVNDLVLTGYSANTARSGDRIAETDSVGKAFKKIEDNLDIIQGDKDTVGSIAKATDTLNTAINTVDAKIEIINGAEEQEGSIANAISTLSASIETDYVKKTDYDTKIEALQKEIDALKALIEQYHPTSTDPGEDTGEETGG